MRSTEIAEFAATASNADNQFVEQHIVDGVHRSMMRVSVATEPSKASVRHGGGAFDPEFMSVLPARV
jgi:hypothetical protein